ncbi:MAG: spore coat protein CotJB [Lachnospiraceae bacterium]|nr:spore coat protein CotJB [Lachnospiraceae bacterium]
MTNMNIKPCDRKKLLNEIGCIEFVLTELNLYLDTHPYDQNAIEKFTYFNDIRNNMMNDYAENFGPLMLNYWNGNKDKWNWALNDMPWEGGYY